MNKIRQKSALKTQLSESRSRLDVLTENLSDAKLNTKSFIMNTPDEFLQIAEGKAELAEFTTKEAEAKALHDTEKLTNTKLQAEFDAISLVFTVADLSEQYNQIDTAKAQLEALEQALDRAQTETLSLSTVDTASAVRDELQNCLVNKALGQDVGKELERLEKAITKTEANDTAVNSETLAAQNRHDATIAGLEAKILTERIYLADLIEDANIIKAVLLGDKSKAIGSAYAQAAQKALTELLKLMALDAEIVTITGRPSGLLPPANWDVALPKIAGMPRYKHYDGQYLIDAERVGLNIGEASAALKVELTHEGFR
jgi:hypothetical protein